MGKFGVSVFAILLRTFVTVFAKIAITIDHVHLCRRPEPGNIGSFVTVCVA